jgi:hypothetical protein
MTFHGGCSDISNHFETKKHKVAIQVGSSSTKLTSFFKNNSVGEN